MDDVLQLRIIICKNTEGFINKLMKNKFNFK